MIHFSSLPLRSCRAAFVYSPSDVYREQDAVLIQNTTASLLFMLIAVLAAVFVLSFNFAMMAALTLALYSCCVHMFGWMVLTGLKLNSLSVIPLLLSVGLCVDYCAHHRALLLAHVGFLEIKGLGQRCRAVVRQCCMPEISTGLSQMPLAFSQSAVFTTFFIMMTGMVLVGLFHALCVLPVCLSFLPDTEGDKDCCVAGSATPRGEDRHIRRRPSAAFKRRHEKKNMLGTPAAGQPKAFTVMSVLRSKICSPCTFRWFAMDFPCQSCQMFPSRRVLDALEL